MHKLTEKLAKHIGQDLTTWEARDREIVEFLQKVLLDICRLMYGSYSGAPARTAEELKEVLGLSDSKPKPEVNDDLGDLVRPKECHPKLPELANIYGFNRCADCGNYYKPKDSKPIDKPLRERLAERLRDSCEEKGWYVMSNEKHWQVPDWLMVADTAITFLSERNK